MTDYAAAPIDWAGDATTLLDLVKQQLAIEPCDTSLDDELSLYIAMACQAAEDYIDNKLVSQPVIDRFSRSRSPVPLHYYPFMALTTVTVDGVDATADYETFFDHGLTWVAVSRTCATRGNNFNQLDIAYTAGFASVPADVAYVIARTAVALRNNTTTGQVKKETVVGVGSVEYVTGEAAYSGLLSTSTLSVLDRYRRISA